MYLVYVLHWPGDAYYTDETRSPDVILHFITVLMHICGVSDGNKHRRDEDDSRLSQFWEGA